jgi:hypothetical protein
MESVHEAFRIAQEQFIEAAHVAAGGRLREDDGSRDVFFVSIVWTDIAESGQT